jgi:hypothetical protein
MGFFILFALLNNLGVYLYLVFYVEVSVFYKMFVNTEIFFVFCLNMLLNIKINLHKS